MRLQLTKRTEYAARACVLLATAESCPISSRRIAEQMSIPDRFLPQVMADLSRAGLVAAVSGMRGGYCLRRDPSEISLLDLVETIEGPGWAGQADASECAHGDGRCGLHAAWARARAAFESVLAETSVARIAMDRHGAPAVIGPGGPERKSP